MDRTGIEGREAPRWLGRSGRDQGAARRRGNEGSTTPVRVGVWQRRERPARRDAGRRSRRPLCPDDPEVLAELAEFAPDCGVATGGTRGTGDENQVDARTELHVPRSLPQEPLGSVPRHGVPHPTGGDHGHAGGIVGRTLRRVDDDEVAGALTTTTEHGRDLASVPESVERHGAQGAQAVSLARPRRRRSFTIARPARVRMRERKPCFRARRRLFGWKVRFMRGTLRRGRVSAHRTWSGS